MVKAMNQFGNPSSLSTEGRAAHNLVEQSRAKVANLIGAQPNEIIFTSGGTEANNIVLLGIFPSLKRRKIITSIIEHPSVYETAKRLKTRGYDVSFVPVDKQGKIDLDIFKTMLDENTALVSTMLVNNEIGTIQDIKTIAELAHSVGALVHTDAVQALGKIPLDVRSLDVDYLSISAHKIGGPKGIGALYVRNGAPYDSLLFGGGQEQNRRAGTENTIGIAGFGQACAQSNIAAQDKIRELRNLLHTEITTRISDTIMNSPDDSIPGILNISFAGVEGETILLALDAEGIAVSTGSACASRSIKPSRVLVAISGNDAERAHNSVRFSLGPENTESEIHHTVDTLEKIIKKYRDISPLGEKHGK